MFVWIAVTSLRCRKTWCGEPKLMAPGMESLRCYITKYILHLAHFSATRLFRESDCCGYDEGKCFSKCSSLFILHSVVIFIKLMVYFAPSLTKVDLVICVAYIHVLCCLKGNFNASSLKAARGCEPGRPCGVVWVWSSSRSRCGTPRPSLSCPLPIQNSCSSNHYIHHGCNGLKVPMLNS